MSKIRLAVIGAGQFGKNHCRVIRESGRAELVAVVDTDSVRAADAAASFSAQPFTDYRE
ncbi:MAG: Gfo/Idh/MocA family oxidoreductase, partial [Acidobacteriia bacterium]|nr:Gfo/Idh/MocA family oxidoreductase [Terriglobia bacterium]